MKSDFNRDEQLKKLWSMKNHSQFEKYIDSITFPYHKNFTFSTMINFQFPLTILVGKNGSGKSSALQALYGAPKGKDLSDFWFSTQLDPIGDFKEIGEMHSYFYNYTEDRQQKTVLYQRIHHKARNDPDYWETSYPRAKYGMSTERRYNPVQKELIYLDFRSELSAFDKYFYFGTLDGLRSKSKQNFLRRKSAELKNVVKYKEIRKLRKNAQNEKVIELSQEELDAISGILQEDYTEGRLIRHKLFKFWGDSILLKKGSHSYSEAHAGSGEIAVVILVHKVINAQPNSLILLDEPEVSLHPGAQKQLMDFLIEQIKMKKHQVIISTHSPIFTEDMPKEAVKRFIRNPETGKIDILDECYPSEAFKFLGMSSRYDNVRIHVEDELAQKIVYSVMEKEGERFSNFSVFFTPGGASYIKQSYILHYAQVNTKKNFVLFDGDQMPNQPIIDLSMVTVKDNNKDFLKNEIKKMTGQDIEFIKDGGDGAARDDQIIDAQKKYIEYYKEFVQFLPKMIPEEIIWDDAYMEKFVDLASKNAFKEIVKEVNYKQKICKTALVVMGDESSNSINAIHNMLLKNWIKNDDDSQKQIRNILHEFMNLVNS